VGFAPDDDDDDLCITQCTCWTPLTTTASRIPFELALSPHDTPPIYMEARCYCSGKT